MAPSIKELVQHLQKGDKSSFTRLYHIYEGKLYRYVLSIAKSPALADDVVQEVFIKIWEQRRSLDPEKSFQAFVFTVARNHVLNLMKRASRDVSVRSEIFAYAEMESNSTKETLDLRETETLLRQAMDRLPVQQRRTFKLCKLDGLTYKEAAKKLNITTGTVNAHMVKALKTIREYLSLHGVSSISLFLFFLL